MAERETFENGRIAGLQVITCLGSGGFGAVWQAYDPKIDRMVAVKILHADKAADPEFRMRFIQEARYLDRAGTDLVVGVHSLDELPDGRPYIVMEHANGGSLQERLTERLPPDGAAVEELTRVIRGVGDCLASLHRAGLVHRDIKPANLLIRRRDGAGPVDGRLLGDTEQLVLADFGVARATGPDLPSAASIVVQSRGWSAPEQLLSTQAPTARADLFSASVIILWVASGQVPIWTGLRPEPVEVPAGLITRHPQLTAQLRRGLAFDPHDRPADATVWSTSLLDALSATTTDRTTPWAPPPTPTWAPPSPSAPPAPAHPGPSPTPPAPAHPGPSPQAPPAPPRSGVGRPGAAPASTVAGRRRRKLTLGRGLLAIAVVALAVAAVPLGGRIVDAVTDPLTIVGPGEAAVGDELVFYIADLADGTRAQWTVGAQTAQGATATITPSSSGRLQVRAEVDGSTATREVTISDAGPLRIEGPALVAVGESARFQITDAPTGATISWSNGSGDPVTGPNLTVEPSGAGVVTLSAEVTPVDGPAVTVVRSITVEP